MKTTLTRNEKLLIGAILSFGGLLIALFTQVSLKQDVASQFETRAGYINYEMGRPTESYSEYSISGRDVDHSYEALKAREIAQLKAADKKADAQKKAELKKKEDAKKTVAAAASPKAIVLNASPKAIVSGLISVVESKNDSNNFVNNYSGNYNQQQATPAPAEPDQKDAKNKKSFAQWRAIIFATPTRETLALFIEAYRKGELTSTEFQAMAQDLIEQSDEKYKGLGILALRAKPSLQSLSQLTHLSVTGLSAAMQNYLSEGIAAYMQDANISVVNQALQTKDKVLISKILTLLNASLPKISQGDYSSLVDSRNRRDTASTMTIASFKVLLPSLTALVSTGDSELASLARVSASYIQSANTVASN